MSLSFRHCCALLCQRLFPLISSPEATSSRLSCRACTVGFVGRLDDRRTSSTCMTITNLYTESDVNIKDAFGQGPTRLNEVSCTLCPTLIYQTSGSLALSKPCLRILDVKSGIGHSVQGHVPPTQSYQTPTARARALLASPDISRTSPQRQISCSQQAMSSFRNTHHTS